MNKFVIILLIIVTLLLILYFTGKKSVHHEISINASPEKVWKVLTNANTYNEWNPTMELVSGEIKVGEKVTYQFTQNDNNSYKVPITVKKLFLTNY